MCYYDGIECNEHQQRNYGKWAFLTFYGKNVQHVSHRFLRKYLTRMKFTGTHTANTGTMARSF